MSFEDGQTKPVLSRQKALTPAQIAEWQVHPEGLEDVEDHEMDVGNQGDSPDVSNQESSSTSEVEGMDEDDEEDFLPLDLGWYFDQFDLGPKERIRLCSTYASMLRAQETLAPAKKRRRAPDKIIDLTKD